MKPINLVYGSVYGSAHYVMSQLQKTLEAAGHCTQLLEQPQPQQLNTECLLIVVTSTTGNGELPTRLQPLLQQLEHSKKGLTGLHYALVALGDSSYTHFCGGGRKLAQALDACGAQALAPALEIDANHCINPEDEALPWILKRIEEHA